MINNFLFSSQVVACIRTVTSEHGAKIDEYQWLKEWSYLAVNNLLKSNLQSKGEFHANCTFNILISLGKYLLLSSRILSQVSFEQGIKMDTSVGQKSVRFC